MDCDVQLTFWEIVRSGRPDPRAGLQVRRRLVIVTQATHVNTQTHTRYRQLVTSYTCTEVNTT